MAFIQTAQLISTGFVRFIVNRALDVAHDPGFYRVLRREGWRFLVAIAKEARAAWLRSGQ
ncbi:MAG: hypothetical protein U0R67_10675 [Micropruina glycogenica]